MTDNHSKPVYKKDSKVNDLDVMLYYYDERDGPSFSGWWFGPKVGGDQVWAYHPDKSSPTPPLSGWKVPYDGPVDTTLILDPTFAANDTSRGGRDRDQRRSEDDRRQQTGEDKKRAEEKRKEDQARKAEEAKRRQEDEKKRKADAEEQKRRDEAQRKVDEETRKQEEMKRKREAEERRRVEQKSMLAIRRVIQKVRAATPDNFQQLQAELEEEVRKEIDNTGTNAARIKEESEKGLEQARKRIEQLQEQRRKEEEKKAAEHALKRAAEERARALIQQLLDLVTAAENQAVRLKDIAKPLDEDSSSKLIVAEVEATSQAVEDAGMESKRMTKECTDFILAKGQEMKDPAPSVPGEPVSELKQVLAMVLQRINDVTKGAEATLLFARGAKEKAVKRAAAVERTREIETVFEKYDRDCDEFLSRREVQQYTKGEYGFTLPQETLDAIWKNMVEDGDRGVKIESFPWLKTMIGVAREVSRDKDRLRDRLEKEKVICGMKDGLKDRVKEAGKAVADADKEVAKAEKLVATLAAKVKKTPPPQMIAIADETDRLIEEAREAFLLARQEIDSSSEGLEDRYEKDLKAFLALEAKHLELHMGRLDARVARCDTLSTRYREQTGKKKTQELERLRKQACKVLRYNQKLHNLSLNALFHLLDTDANGEIDQDEWNTFFENADMDVQVIDMELTPEEVAKAKEKFQSEDDPAKREEEKREDGEDGRDDKELDAAAVKKESLAEKVVLSPQELSRLFTYLVEDGHRSISRETFFRVVRLSMKVINDAVMTSGMSISSSRTLRRLERNEVVEVTDGPLRDPTLSILRVFCKAVSDGSEGWVSITGNQGSSYLVEGGSLFKVVKETILTESFELDGEKASIKLSETPRKLKEGTVIEVYEWPRREESSGLMRLRGRVRSSGAVGWVTTTGNTGSVFLEVV